MVKFLIENWKEYTVEFVLVIVAITIPFAVSKWIDNVQEKRLENQYIEMAIGDFDDDLNLLKINLNGIETDRKLLIEFVESTEKNGKINEQQLQKIIPCIVKYYHFIPSNSTFKDLESTGNMKLFSNLQTRKTIFKYYRLATLISRMENTYEKETENFLKPTILKYFPVRGMSQYEFLFKGNTKIKIKEIENSVDFENSLLIKIDLLNNLRRVYESLIEMNENIADELKK